MKSGLLFGVALMGGLSLSCDKTVTYSYFRIAATVDPTVSQDLLDVVEACAVIAETPTHTDSADLRCVRRHVGRDLGVIEYSTEQTTGAITFSIVMNGLNQQRLARGEVGPLDIVRGQTVEGALVVKEIPGALGPDAGGVDEPDAASTPDGGAPDTAGASDTAMTASDAAADQAVSTPDAAADKAATPDAGPDAAADKAAASDGPGAG